MPTLSDWMPLNYFTYGKPFTGSIRNLSYRIIREEKTIDEAKYALLQVSVWPGPFSFGKTPEEKKLVQSFPFDEEGRAAALEWVNNTFLSNPGLYDKAPELLTE